jgi:LPXTG-site transpeptidase (sortase) family protein
VQFLHVSHWQIKCTFLRQEKEVRRLLRIAEKVLWITGGAAFALSASYIGYGAFYQRFGEEQFMAFVTSPAPPALTPAKGAIMGRLRIPRLSITTVIFEGTAEPELAKGIGHWIGSPIAGDGNVVLAAHRDTFFRGLGDIRPGDRIELDTASGQSIYRVEGTQIVWPDSVEVLRPTPAPTLTLITCYPFEFFGHAPQRFIVRSRR